MEPFTSGKVSVLARNAYVADNPTMADAFTKCRRGYVMRAWDTQIRMARACGRGAAAGRRIPEHPFDARSYR